MPAPNASDVRSVIAFQPSIGQSIAALIRAIAHAASRALDHEDPGPLRDIATSMSDDAKAWSDAVLANTPLAVESAALDHEPVRMPGHVAGAFARPVSPADQAAEDKRLADAEAERQRIAAEQQAAADVRTGQAGTATAEHQAAVQAGRTDPSSPYYDPNAVRDAGNTKIGGGAIHF
jgi:hypothetical protein